MRFQSIQVILTGACLAAAMATAQIPTPGAISFTATTDNVPAKNSIRIDLARWSNDAEVEAIAKAWKNPGVGSRNPGAAAGFPAANATAGKIDAGVTGTARIKPQDPNAAAAARAAAAAAAQARAAREAAQRQTPESAALDAMKKNEPLGFLWSSAEVTGYNIYYAVRQQTPDGGERIILVTDKRLGEWNDTWKVTGAGQTPDYEFSVIELRLNAKGEGEGKASLTGKINLDSDGKSLMLENYSASPVILRSVKHNNVS